MHGDRGRDSGRDARRFTATHRDHYQRYDSQYRGHRTQQFDGRVRRLERRTGGYRVWLDHGDHSFWVPNARFLLSPLRIGLSVSFGGFWNPAGYYNVYDYGSYGGGYGAEYGSGYARGYSASSTLEGYVEQFDYATGALSLRDDDSGRLTTVLLRRDDPDFGYLQTGDWVTLSGVWTRNRNFEAYRIVSLVQR